MAVRHQLCYHILHLPTVSASTRSNHHRRDYRHILPAASSSSLTRYLTNTEHVLAQERLTGSIVPPQLKVSRNTFAHVFDRWHWYFLVLL